jgi:Rod binding domain-containing protein
MKIPPPELASRPISLTQAPAPSQRKPVATTATAAERHAAQEFEAIFLRKMLACMEKSSKVDGGQGSHSSSTNAYSSMIVGALADAVAAAGGIGLGQSILHTIESAKPAPQDSPTKTDKTPNSNSPPQGSEPRTVHGLLKGPV